jgi:hypothetical protein
MVRLTAREIEPQGNSTHHFVISIINVFKLFWKVLSFVSPGNEQPCQRKGDIKLEVVVQPPLIYLLCFCYYSVTLLKAWTYILRITLCLYRYLNTSTDF